jgi:hypothetical protein
MAQFLLNSWLASNMALFKRSACAVQDRVHLFRMAINSILLLLVALVERSDGLQPQPFGAADLDRNLTRRA